MRLGHPARSVDAFAADIRQACGAYEQRTRSGAESTVRRHKDIRLIQILPESGRRND